MIKKLDIFVLKAFLQLFCATFFISLFIFMLQFMWMQVEKLVGKGLSLWVLAKFFYYAGLTLVPMSLPLGVLLASLITFGNMGEKLELLSMKAAGISLARILMPLLVFCTFVCCGSFYFQDQTAPEATKQMATLLWGMKQKNPELEIPEGTFYNDIPGYNLYVERKDMDTGHLYNVMIYSSKNAYEDAEIVLADSGFVQSTADQRHLKLTLWNGERFKSLQGQRGMGARVNSPYMRETFIEEIDMIEFDNNFNVLDASLFSGNARTKKLSDLNHGMDSIRHSMDSVGRYLYSVQCESENLMRSMRSTQVDSASIPTMLAALEPFDSIRQHVAHDTERNVMYGALRRVSGSIAEYEYRRLISDESARQYRLHDLERHKKFTLSLCCLIFFFIGAPLGAIIRKGGLGIPVVTSVVIFIFYYMIDVVGQKMAKSGDWNMTFGMWMSTMILVPIAAWLTYKSNRDSALFNSDAYLLFFEKYWNKAKTTYNRINGYKARLYRRGS